MRHCSFHLSCCSQTLRSDSPFVEMGSSNSLIQTLKSQRNKTMRRASALQENANISLEVLLALPYSLWPFFIPKQLTNRRTLHPTCGHKKNPGTEEDVVRLAVDSARSDTQAAQHEQHRAEDGEHTGSSYDTCHAHKIQLLQVG